MVLYQYGYCNTVYYREHYWILRVRASMARGYAKNSKELKRTLSSRCFFLSHESGTACESDEDPHIFKQSNTQQHTTHN